MLKKFGKLNFLITFFSSLLFIFILLTLYTTFNIHKNNKKITNYSQITTKLPVDKYNKVYFAITKANEWNETNDLIVFSYDGIIANTTSDDFTNWTIALKVPSTTTIENTWNCTACIENNFLYITPFQNSNNIIPGKEEISFGFLLTSINDLIFRSTTISGNLKHNYFSDKSFKIYFSLSIISLIALLLTFIIKHIFLTQIQIIKKRQEHDNQIIEQTMKTFSNFIDNKDPYTQGHSSRVAVYVREMAKRMGLDEQSQLTIYYAGLMHDIGKLTIKDELLNKTSKLSSEEWGLIQQHTTNGASLLKNFTILPEINDAVLYHHERFDGNGYMNRLSGTNIPLVARMVCIADAFDAMNTNRCYRLKFSEERIISELERCKGKQFDPVLVPYMVEIIRDGTIYKI